jgi:hypothetical protein
MESYLIGAWRPSPFAMEELVGVSRGTGVLATKGDVIAGYIALRCAGSLRKGEKHLGLGRFLLLRPLRSFCRELLAMVRPLNPKGSALLVLCRSASCRHASAIRRNWATSI